MQPLAVPLDTVRDVLASCVAMVREAGLKLRLAGVQQTLVLEEQRYQGAGAASTLHGMVPLTPVAGVSGTVTGAELEDVYTDRLAKKGTVPRAHYDRLKAAPAHGRCPMCGCRVVSTLDHYLPKSVHPALAITPMNLVPSCSDCNFAKKAFVANGPLDQLLHPYFDNIDTDVWLSASLTGTGPFAAVFIVRPPSTWSPMVTARVLNQFIRLDLPQLYSSHAAEELGNLREALATVSRAGGTAAVSEHLRREAQSRSANRKNSWQSALYDCLWQHPAYCGGGFRS